MCPNIIYKLEIKMFKIRNFKSFICATIILKLLVTSVFFGKLANFTNSIEDRELTAGHRIGITLYILFSEGTELNY